MAITPVTTPEVIKTAVSATTLSFTAFTPSVGELLVIKVIGEGGSGTAPAVPSGGPTFTAVTPIENIVSECFVGVYTATVASSSSITLVVTSPKQSGSTPAPHWSAVLERWPAGSTLGAIRSTVIGGPSAPSTTLVTTGTGSAISWCNGDFSAKSAAGHTYNTTSATPVEDGLDDQSTSFYVAYYAYQQSASPGTQTLGITAPINETWCIQGVEVVPGAGGGGPVQDGPQTVPMLLPALNYSYNDASTSGVTIFPQRPWQRRFQWVTQPWLNSDDIPAVAGVSITGPTATLVLAAPAGTISVTLPGATATLVLAAPAGTVSTSLPGVTAAVVLAAPAGTVSVGLPGTTGTLVLAAPAGTISVTLPGVTAALTLAAPTGGFSTLTNFSANGVTATVVLAAPAGSVSVTLPGATGTLVLAAPAGKVSVTLPGTTGTLVFAAPAGAVSVTLPGATASVVLGAPAGTISVTLPGTTGTIVFAAPAGNFTTGSGFNANGVTAAVVLAAPAGVIAVTLPGVTAALVFAAPAGGFNTLTNFSANGVTAAVVLAAPAGRVSVGINGPTATVVFQAKPGGFAVPFQALGVTAALIFAAPPGSVVAALIGREITIIADLTTTRWGSDLMSSRYSADMAASRYTADMTSSRYSSDQTSTRYGADLNEQ